MSGSDSQNISGRDYDDSDEAGNQSFSPSTGGSTFDQIDEVDPRTVEDVASSLRRGGAPRELRDSGQISGPEASRRPNALSAPGEASSSAPNPRRPSASPAPARASSSVPDLAEAEPTGDEPSTTRKKMLFLNSEVVQQQKCLLTCAEIDEIHVLLRGRVPYKIRSRGDGYGGGNCVVVVTTSAEVLTGAHGHCLCSSKDEGFRELEKDGLKQNSGLMVYPSNRSNTGISFTKLDHILASISKNLQYTDYKEQLNEANVKLLHVSTSSHNLVAVEEKPSTTKLRLKNDKEKLFK
nr:hypothetical protein Iba_chr15cCG5030 [Ipomoea batatas]